MIHATEHTNHSPQGNGWKTENHKIMKEDKLKKIPKNPPVPIRNKPVGPSDNFWKDLWWIALLEVSVMALLIIIIYFCGKAT